MADQICPICKASVDPSQRYPNYVCIDCQARMVDSKGKPIHFYNTDILGTGVTPDEPAWIDGIEVYASEAHFGGIVIRLKKIN